MEAFGERALIGSFSDGTIYGRSFCSDHKVPIQVTFTRDPYRVGERISVMVFVTGKRSFVPTSRSSDTFGFRPTDKILESFFRFIYHLSSNLVLTVELTYYVGCMMQSRDSRQMIGIFQNLSSANDNL